jgi:hypothetical protein
VLHNLGTEFRVKMTHQPAVMIVRQVYKKDGISAEHENLIAVKNNQRREEICSYLHQPTEVRGICKEVVGY